MSIEGSDMIEWSNYELGSYRINCPMCSRKASDKTLGLTVEANSRSMAHCFRCGFVETFKLRRDPCGAHLDRSGETLDDRCQREITV